MNTKQIRKLTERTVERLKELDKCLAKRGAYLPRKIKLLEGTRDVNALLYFRLVGHKYVTSLHEDCCL